MNKLMPNYGWVQNTSNLSTVRDTIELVPEHGIKHSDLLERIKQDRIDKRNLANKWTWDARCRIKAICACGLAKIERNIQGYVLTKLGITLKECNKANKFYKRKRLLSEDEINVFREGILTNPPVIRVLELLFKERRGENIGLSKYDIGANLGFVGDIGFTHYEPEWIVANGYNFNYKEGDADKWARTILSWLLQVGWVEKSLSVKTIMGRKLILFKATSEVENVLRYNTKRIQKIVPSEMLCSNHHHFPKLIQKRRAIILQQLNSNKIKLSELLIVLNKNGIETNEQTVKFEIISLKQAGFRIMNQDNYYKLIDKIDLDVNPDLFRGIYEEENILEITIKKMVVKYESTIPPRLVDNLLRYGCIERFHNEFESTVSQFFKFLGYKTTYLGQGKGRVSDVIARYIASTYPQSYGLIIDAKATSTKYSFPIGDIRKMKEYIETHGNELLVEHIPKHAFAFVSSSFVKNVEKPLKEISSEKNVNGSAIQVEKLLELGNLVKEGRIEISKIYDTYTTNRLYEITI